MVASSKESSKSNKRQRSPPKRIPVTSTNEKDNLAAWNQVPPWARGSVPPPPKKKKAKPTKLTNKPRKGRGKRGRKGKVGTRKARRSRR